MPKINLAGTKIIDDPFYRYKMTFPEIKTEKKSYIVFNFESICKELDRDPSHVAQFLNSRFGCSTKLKKGEYFIQKDITPKDFLTEIKIYIDYFVLCQSCDNPETVPDKDTFTCKACGHCSTIESNDTTNKLLKLLKSIKHKNKSKVKT